MALAHVSTKTGGGAASATTVSSGAQAHTAGNLLVAAFTGQTAGVAIASIVNTAGDTWTQVSGSPFAFAGNANYLYMYYVTSTAGHATDDVTVTYGGGASVVQRAMAVYEFSGQDTSSVFNASANGGATSGTAIASGTITLAAAEEVIVAIMETDAGGTPTGTGVFAGNVVVPLNFFAAMYGITTANTAATATGTSSAKWEILAAAFKASAGGGGGGARQQTLTMLGVGV